MIMITSANYCLCLKVISLSLKIVDSDDNTGKYFRFLSVIKCQNDSCLLKIDLFSVGYRSGKAVSKQCRVCCISDSSWWFCWSSWL